MRLEQLLELRGIGLLTGEPSSGKTTLCRRLVDLLRLGLSHVVYVPLSTGNVMDMYKSIAREPKLPTERNRAAAFRQIRVEVSRLLLEGKQIPVVIIDKAHHVRNEVLEDPRLFANHEMYSEMDSENRLYLLFAGPTELRRRLSTALHESLDQRIVMRYHLDGLAREELPEYLAHRLRGADCELPLFKPQAIEAIWQATRALPRRVNRLAHVR